MVSRGVERSTKNDPAVECGEVGADACEKVEKDRLRELGVAKVRKENAGVCVSDGAPDGILLQLKADDESTAVFSAEGNPRSKPRIGDSGRADMGSGASCTSWLSVV